MGPSIKEKVELRSVVVALSFISWLHSLRYRQTIGAVQLRSHGDTDGDYFFMQNREGFRGRAHVGKKRCCVSSGKKRVKKVRHNKVFTITGSWKHIATFRVFGCEPRGATVCRRYVEQPMVSRHGRRRRRRVPGVG